MTVNSTSLVGYRWSLKILVLHKYIHDFWIKPEIAFLGLVEDSEISL